jgi:hypothetical protein
MRNSRIVVGGNMDDSQRDEWYRRFLEYRGINPYYDTVCPSCSGSGVQVYGSTATWHSGIGGQAMTSGVCDKCWGSGKKNAPWANLKALEGRIRAYEMEIRALKGNK